MRTLDLPAKASPDDACPAHDVDLEHLSEREFKWLANIACPELHMTMGAMRRLRRRSDKTRSQRAERAADLVRGRVTRLVNGEPEPEPKHPLIDLWAPLS